MEKFPKRTSGELFRSRHPMSSHIPYDKAGTDEYIEIFKTLWGEKEPSYQGEFYSFEPIQFAPKPVQIPGPDIWVGGQSRAAIRRAAKLGNAWHPVGANPASPLEPEEMVEEIAYLETYCESLNRDPSEVTVVLKAPIYDKENNYGGKRRRFSGSPEQIHNDIAEYQNLGVSHLVLDTRSSELNQSIEKMDWLHEEVIAKSKT